MRTSRSAAHGVIWARIGRPGDWGEGNVRTQDQKWALDFSAVAGAEMREGAWTAIDTVSIPEGMRGTTQPVRLLGRQIGSGGPPRLDNASSIGYEITFKETRA